MFLPVERGGTGGIDRAAAASLEWGVPCELQEGEWGGPERSWKVGLGEEGRRAEAEGERERAMEEVVGGEGDKALLCLLFKHTFSPCLADPEGKYLSS